MTLDAGPEDALAEDRQRLLEELLAEEGLDPGGAEEIRRRTGGGRPPLSFAQERMFFLDRWSPGSAAYNVAAQFRLAGELDRPALAASLAGIVRRHEVLRSRYEEIEGRPAQRIVPPDGTALPVVDLAGLPPERAEPESVRLARAEARRPFDLAAGPLLRGHLWRVTPSDHRLSLVMHHIVSDGWSLGVLLRELVAGYRGEPPPEPPVQYADFAAWQRDHLAGERLEELVAHWRERLDGAPAVLDLPADRPRPPERTYDGGVEVVALPEGLGEALRRAARERRGTLFMGLFAAFVALLARLTGERDLVVGSPVANRNRTEIEGLVGFFVNTLVLRTRADGDPTFGELLDRVRDTTLAAYDHQDLPFEKLVEELDVPREPSHAPLFQVMMILQNAPMPRFDLPGLAVAPWSLPGVTAKFDLTATFLEAGGRLQLSLDFNLDLFDRTTVRRLGRSFRALAAAAAADLGMPLSRLPVTTAAERWQVVGEWNDTAADARGEALLHRRVERQVERAPDAIALVFEDRCLSYGALAARSADLARRLRDRGVGPESRVGILCERSLALVVGVLGAVRAGGAWVPLDPEAPEARLGELIDDAGLAAVVTQERLADRLPASTPVVVADAPSAGGAGAPPADAVDPRGAAYVIYTSGSTGRPKGVVNTHEAICNRIDWMQAAYGLGPDDPVLQKTPTTFDVSVWELFWPLVTGARMVLALPGRHGDPAYLADLIERERVTTLHFVPSMLRAFLDGRRAGDCPSLRRVIASGEALTPDLERRFFERLGGELHNLYGPTEAAIDVTAWRCGARRPDGSVPIGRPITNLRVHGVDAGGRPSPIGVVGELVIGGVGLARCYLDRPGLTAERFVPDPLAGTPGARRYRTGDLTRLRPDGAVVFVGRNDHQVKLRGFRVELGEIEIRLAEHPAVREVVVVHRDDEHGGRLVAYVVPGEGAGGAGAEALRDFLRERLPDYMVPASFVGLDALPLTSSGKVDRKALPEPAAGPDSERPYVAPAGEVEEVLAAIWSQVVGVERVGVHDNYFALGGDSIRAIQVIALAKERGLELDLQQLFRHQTIAELSRAVGFGSGPVPPPEPLAPFAMISEEDRVRLPDDAEDAYPLAVLQAGMLYHMDLTPDASVYHNINSVHLEVPYEAESFRKAVDAVVARHSILRTSFHLTGFSEPLQIVHREAHLPIEVVDLRDLSPGDQERAVAERIEEERRRPFDVTRAPLWRFCLQLRSDTSFQLTMAENHAIFDGWSLHASLDELFERYLALLDGREPPPAPPPAVEYRDFVHLERRAVASEEHRSFWRDRLHDAPMPQLPESADLAAEGSAGHRMHTESWVIPRPLADGLRRVARRNALPLKSVLLAAHCKVMSLLSGRPEVLTGLASNGRPETPDGEQVRGLFLNMVPFRLDLPPGTWVELARRTFEAEIETLPYRVFPMGILQQELGDQPLLETVFTYVHFHSVQELVRGGELKVRDFRLSEETHFPLATTFRVSPLSETLSLVVVCDTAKLPAHRIAAVRGYFDRVLAAIAEAPEDHHGSLPLLGDGELHRALREWGRGPAEEHPERLDRLFRAALERDPDAVALESEAGERTFAELAARADRLARWLAGRGVGPESRVALAFEPGEEMIVAVLGVLGAGAAYVPLDPGHPADRLAWTVEDAAPVLALAAGPSAETLAAALPGDAPPVIDLDREGASIDRLPPDPPPAGGSGDSLAYVLYTSGSTGRPKGVMVPHRAIANRCAWMQSAHPLGPDDRVVFKTPYVFDASIWELFAAWAGGARVVVARAGGHKDAGYLADLVEERSATVLQLVPSMLRVFLEEPDLAGRCRTLRRLFCGGEELTPELVARAAERLPGVDLVNLYGPTEVAIDATSWRAPGGAVDRVPIGRPISNVRAVVADVHLQPAPPGVPGELLVGGPGVARGYHGRPGLTAARFLPDPFSGRAGSRLFRTGDEVRWLDGGELAFLGRLDRQVKVRGFRIELGEIEAVLRRDPAVAEAVVVPREDPSGNRELVAHVTPSNGEPPSVERLREHLERVLPEYMVPALWVFLDQLPRTPGGKLDRRALAALDRDDLQIERAYEAPRTEVEETLAEIWSTVLGVPRVGRQDDFFVLGGHSLSVIQVVSRVRKAFEAKVSLKTLYDHRTLAGVAAAIEQGLTRVEPAPVEPPAPVAAPAPAAPVDVAALSDEEVDSLLGEMLHEEGGDE